MFELINKALDALKRLRDRRNPVVPVPPSPTPAPVNPVAPVDPANPDAPKPVVPVPPSPSPVPVAPASPGILRRLFASISSRWVAWLITAAVTVVFAKLGFIAPPVPVVPDVPIFQGGWVNDPEAVEAIKSQMEVPNFADTPAGKVFQGEGDIPLWKTAVKATGAFLPARNQGQVGSCVSFGTAAAIEYLQCVQMDRGDNLEFRDLVQEEIYGGSRVEVGKNRIRGDGSVGAWAATAVQKYGVIPRGTYLNGKYDLRKYSESRCRQWGNSGIPDDLEPVAKLSLVRTTAAVANAAEAKKALGQGYPIAVCSDQGFSSTRDSDGNLRASGSWGHCMGIIGYRSGKRPSFLICNSWGPNWLSGPMGSEPIPDGCFWADERIVDGMLRQGDSWAFSDAVGFPGRKIDWFVFAAPAAPNPNDRLFAALRGNLK